MAAEEKRVTTAYHRVRDDIRRALASLGLKLVHEDGTEPGKSCMGFLADKLHEASKGWHGKAPTAGPEQTGDPRLADEGDHECG